MKENNAFYTTSWLGTLFGIGTPIKKSATEANASYLVIVTPVGVNLEDKILREAGSRNIAVLQSDCQYFKKGKDVYLKVSTSTLKNDAYLRNKVRLIGTYAGGASLIDFSK